MILLYLLYNGRLPDRIITIFNIESILCFFGILLKLIKEGRICEGELGGRIIGSCLVAMLPIMLYSFTNTYNSQSIYQRELNVYSEFTGYFKERADSVYVVCTGTVASRKQFIIHNNQEQINTIGTSGWSSQSPFIKAKLARLGVDLDGDILLDENLYFLTPDLANADALNVYYQSVEYHDLQYVVVDTFELTNGTVIYSVKWKRPY